MSQGPDFKYSIFDLVLSIPVYVKIGHNSNTSAEPSLRAIGGEVLKAIEGWPTLLMIRPAPVRLLFSDFQPR